ncbi:MAG: 4-hydroxybenzoate octaprenyltransferase [Rhodospirillales bacterium]|nr:4-hydroxybenzoate octaprenyltransferase [Rhodospirillales bacterium]MDE2319002.1 4-hydroxybenzoate octaprenyltransferase [Rhodospirillales bacterium]
MSGFTDIRHSGWVARLPSRYLPYILLARLDRPIGAWLLFLPGFWAICLTAHGFWAGLWLSLLFALGAVVMRGAGCVVNDLWDRKMDAQVERTRGRPLAAGMVSPFQALLFLAALCAAGLVILLLLNNTARWLGVASLGLVALYPLAKRVTWWPQAFLGLTFGWGALLGYAAARGHLTWPVVPLYLAAILWIIGYDTIYAHQDRADDALLGVKSTARLFGRRTREALCICYGLCFLLLLVAMSAFSLHRWGYWMMLLPAGLMVWQIIRLDIDNPARCLALFKLNREVGLAVALAILVGWV